MSQKSNKTKELIVGAIIPGIACFILSFLVGGYVIPFPGNPLANAIGNGISGLLSAVGTAIITTLILFKKFEKTDR